LPDGTLPHFMKEFSCVKEFQFVQEAIDHLTVRLVPGEGWDTAMRDYMEKDEGGLRCGAGAGAGGVRQVPHGHIESAGRVTGQGAMRICVMHVLSSFQIGGAEMVGALHAGAPLQLKLLLCCELAGYRRNAYMSWLRAAFNRIVRVRVCDVF